MAKKKIAVIGIGKIAIDQHLPVIDKSRDFEVAATVSTALVGIVMWGSLMGSMLPLVIKRAGFDPATSSAPARRWCSASSN